MIVDANVLLYAENRQSQFHEQALRWLDDALNGDVRVGLPWPTLLAFVRLRSNGRLHADPLTGAEAWSRVQAWLSAPAAWVPTPTARHAEILGGLVQRYGLSGNAIPDAHLAALAVEHGVAVVSADTDFARFTEVRWVNPVAPRT